MDETSLLNGLIAGDKRAFSMLFSAYWKELYAYVIRIIKDKEESVDIVQDAFTSLWQQREQLHEVKSLKGYIFAMVHHKAIRFIKSSIRHRDYVVAMAAYFPDPHHSLEAEIDAHDLAAFINAEIAKLPPKMREVFLLSRNERLSYKEIAVKLSIAENTVRKQVSFSIKYLRMKINKAYFSVGAALFVLIRALLS
ncbi:RNA polymerase sigma-70 factor [Parapedobacter sp. ISTM3]|uniref:RNA polymerase sigma-70 factor, ECF subfamily n=1 Tax=Parapedobacter luteus TaxID=623280 RepID=A0A1T5FJV9_9SPHI|nr:MULTISPECIES: RNA polymerase sigma-70 factor [Parapedobacter]MBK1442417.1 RNA polymerase sigma-70 factor [Parapedobacter sp. ISTM3]SKB96378.1 RNA polymerase sigma-70 factor, ECF subfamily [Parapedobacter luteus]